MKKTVKIGVVGMHRGKGVITLALEDDNMQLRAICDKNEERLEAARRFFEEEKGIKDLLCFTDYEEFLKSDVEAVYLATDAMLHAGQAIQAMEAGKHVISEIPAIDTIEEAKALKNCVKAHPEVKYMIGENCCYWEFVQAWKKMYEEGRFGEAVYAEGEYMHGGDPLTFAPRDDVVDKWRTGLNAIKYITHELGPLLYILNDKVVSVSCMEPEIIYNPYKTGAETGVALFKTAKGAVLRVLICFGAYVGFDHNFMLLGTRGSIYTDRTKFMDEAHSYAKMMDIPGTLDKMFEIPVALGGKGDRGHGGADAKMMKAFIQCIIDDTEPPLNIDMGIQMSIPGIIAHESALQGGVPLPIPEID